MQRVVGCLFPRLRGGSPGVRDAGRKPCAPDREANRSRPEVPSYHSPGRRLEAPALRIAERWFPA